MQKVVRYQCDDCGELFYTEKECVEHEEKHKKIEHANQMLKKGFTLKEIQEECQIWYKLPTYLENVTQDVGFVISHWQCCKKPAYRILAITLEGHLIVRGCGSWSGYFGNEVPVTFVENNMLDTWKRTIMRTKLRKSFVSLYMI